MMSNGSYLKIKLVDEDGEDLDEIYFSRDDVDGALKFASSMIGCIPSMPFGNKLNFLPIATITLTKGLGGVLVWKIKREIYKKEIKPLLKNIKGIK
jgi:hypothetical protein